MAWWWGLAGGVLLLVLVIVGLWLVRRATTAERSRQLQEDLRQASQALSALRQDVAMVRTEAREEAERSRARLSQNQVDHMGVLHKQMVDMSALTQQQLEDVRRAVQERMQHLAGVVGEQLGGHTKVMMEVRGQLGGLAETAKHIQGLSQDIVGLQDILRAPKLRGNLGELLLGEILRQVLPADSYEMQYRMPGLERGTYVVVDAVIHLGDRLVPIDAKFPLESFQRLLEPSTSDEERLRRRRLFLEVVCRHIDSIAEKYVRPDAGTYDFALAYLPAENIYYEAMVRDSADGMKNVVEHAAVRKVIPVSPNTLYAYLLTVAYGLKGLQIERQAEAMRAQLATFQKKFITFYQVFEKVGRNLDLAQRGYDDASKRALKLHDQVSKITGDGEGLDLESPPGVPVISEMAEV